mgnify:CR=1 FL=1
MNWFEVFIRHEDDSTETIAKFETRAEAQAFIESYKQDFDSELFIDEWTIRDGSPWPVE